MDSPFSWCEEEDETVDTILLLTQAFSDFYSIDPANSDVTSPSRPSRRRSRRSSLSACSTTKGSEATRSSQEEDCRDGRRQTGDSATSVPYTVVPENASSDDWNLADGFPFPCPIVRDPMQYGRMYVPGEILRSRLCLEADCRTTVEHKAQFFTKQIEREEEKEVSSAEMRLLREAKRSTDEDSTIFLSEAVRQIPIRLSHYREGDGSGSLFDCWLQRHETESLRDRFARMDRCLRSKFIGLKNSSARVRDKVREKRVTTYKEVAEELVEEIGLTDAADKKSALEAENLKRRVYDVLNVFEAIGLIEKDHKNVYWKGTSVSQKNEIRDLEGRAAHLRTHLSKLRQYLRQVKENYNALEALSARNKELSNSSNEVKLQLPFFLIHVPETTPVDISISSDARRVLFDFAGEDFTMSGDMWALRHMSTCKAQTPSTTTIETSTPDVKMEDANVAMDIESVPGLNQSIHAVCQTLSKNVQPFLPLSLENHKKFKREAITKRKLGGSNSSSENWSIPTAVDVTRTKRLKTEAVDEDDSDDVEYSLHR